MAMTTQWREARAALVLAASPHLPGGLSVDEALKAVRPFLKHEVNPLGLSPDIETIKVLIACFAWMEKEMAQEDPMRKALETIQPFRSELIRKFVSFMADCEGHSPVEESR